MKYIGLLLLLFSVSTLNAGDLSVSPLQLNFFSKGSNQQVIEVKNNSDKVQYVKVDPSRVEHPGEPDQSFLPLQNAPMSFGLVVSPRKLIIPPHEIRNVKVLRIQSPHVPRTHDWVYRINITPAKSELVSPEQQDDDEFQLGLRITIAYAVRVVLRPDQPDLSIKATRDGKTVTISNTGNTTYLLNNLRYCKNPEDAKTCKGLGSNYSSHRLFAGNSWTFTLEDAEPVTFDQLFLMKKRKIITTN